MAQSTSDIKSQIINSIQLQPALQGFINNPTDPTALFNLQTFINSIADPNLPTSQTAIWNLWSYITALILHNEEVLWDEFFTELEALNARGQSPTAGWWQDRMLKFQYSATNPQVIQLIDYAPTYPVIDPSLRIITRVAVKTTTIKQVKIKLAKGVYPSLAPLTLTELNAVKSYADIIDPAGISLSIISLDPDRLYVDLDIYYLGQYVESVVKASVIQAIEDYIRDASFSLTIGGKIIIVGNSIKPGLIDYIQAVPGVDNIVMNEISIRPEGTPFILRHDILLDNPQEAEMSAGYSISEDTAGFTLNDSINMILV